MGKYSMRELNIPTAPQNKDDILTEEQKRIISEKHKTLREIGVYIALYTDDFIWPGHPDGVHNYREDATEVQKLIENNQELPQDLLDRLAYYKPIIEQQLEERR